MNLLTTQQRKAGFAIAKGIQMRGWGLRVNSPQVGRGALVEIKLSCGQFDNHLTGVKGETMAVEATFVTQSSNRKSLLERVHGLSGQGPITLYEDLFAGGFRQQFATWFLTGNQERAKVLLPAFHPNADASTQGKRQGCANRETEVAIGFQDLLQQAATPPDNVPPIQVQIRGSKLAQATSLQFATLPTQQGLQRINRAKGENAAIDALLAGLWGLSTEVARRSFVMPGADGKPSFAPSEATINKAARLGQRRTRRIA